MATALAMLGTTIVCTTKCVRVAAKRRGSLRYLGLLAWQQVVASTRRLLADRDMGEVVCSR
jgi:hypothetical protein